MWKTPLRGLQLDKGSKLKYHYLPMYFTQQYTTKGKSPTLEKNFKTKTNLSIISKKKNENI